VNGAKAKNQEWFVGVFDVAENRSLHIMSQSLRNLYFSVK